MSYEDFNLLKIRVNKGVLFATIDNPPINLLNNDLYGEFGKLAMEISADDNVKVVVFDSADPDYFICHYDVKFLLQYPDKAPPKPTELHGGHQLQEVYRTMPKISIAKIEGRVRGGGSEFVLSLDMRFGAIGKAILSQLEIPLGIIPGGGGTQRLPRLIGRSRAMEVVLSGSDYPAELAERYGYINRALPPEEITPFVEELAYRIASYPSETIAAAKKAVLLALEKPVVEGLIEETHLFNLTCCSPEAKERMSLFLDIGGQTREGELTVSKWVKELTEKLEKK
ncbi:MAG: enoyl-CoA hydratase/isomerase family protein [Candidatus Hodarchaeales archaeon]|jgi:enoyl-CoA hydratase/carnithine racemase